MKIGGRQTRTIVTSADGHEVSVLDQSVLPFEIAWRRLETLADAVGAISNMVVRGAPLIGVTAAYGMWLAMQEDPSDAALARAREALVGSRPTAINLAWAVTRMETRLRFVSVGQRASVARDEADAMADEDVAVNRAIGAHGRRLIEEVVARVGRSRPLRILTHCNAGSLATVDGGTALAPVYAAFAAGTRIEVVVDETRPRNQGARLTAFELREAGVPCVVVADNASGHLLQRGLVDLVIVGADRVAANGDVANKIGTYLKALAARDAGVPFYVACPTSTIDRSIRDGVRDIPIEERSEREVTHMHGVSVAGGSMIEVRIVPEGVRAANPAFDVTPARLVTSLITEAGVIAATERAIEGVFASPLA